MGVTFIGNPFDQDNYDDSDWEMNADDEWVTPPQDIAIVDMLDRGQFNIIIAAGAESSGEDSDRWQDSNDDELDEDYDISEDEDYDPENEGDGYVSDTAGLSFSDHDEFIDSDTGDEDIDYVTYPSNDEPTVSTDKPSDEAPANPTDDNDAD